ncbi:LANO_0E14818g1_1 [Lachancea nothofagi CBS 11611]|uniref:LANO_0E14818g1_1 n=1 Tax=Lachancea nothofagi CBS 11611 TaxID=1266666 RepID=A0A1G4K0C9_9SACH|nr:LANO_0E14818g1_1 [Lachancea nothofagi CBS 11611]
MLKRMLSTNQRFLSHLRRLGSYHNGLKGVYSKLLNEPSFSTLDKNEFLGRQLTPYDFSASILKELAARDVLNANLIHNQLIESLTGYEYAVGAIHARELNKNGGKLSLDSFIQIVKHNPGRVKSSWELFLDNFEHVRYSHDALIAVLDKLLAFDPIDVADGKTDLTIKDLARCFSVIACIKNAGKIPKSYWETLLTACLATNVSTLIPTITTYLTPSVQLTESNNLKLTSYQLYQLFHRYPKTLLEESLTCFEEVFSTFGRSTMIKLTDDEMEADAKFRNCLAEISVKADKALTIPPPTDVPTNIVFDNFLKIVESSSRRLKERNELSRIAIRSLGIYRSNLPRALSFFERDLRPSEEMKYELFLAYIYNAVKHGDKKLLDRSLEIIPHPCRKETSLSIKRALIASFSAFDIEKSLQLYNDSIQDSDKKEVQNRPMSEACLLTESLIVAYLGVEDRDFAQVVFDGAAREKVISGPTAIKQIKKHFTAYGSILEEHDFKQKLKETVLLYIRCL